MSKRLFVGSLPYSLKGAQLNEIFSKFGKVISCDVITDKITGQSKGFAFVEMEKNKEADEAIKNLNETKLEDRTIVVNEARPREERPSRDFNRGGDRGGRRNFSRNSRGGGGNRRY